MKRTLCLAGVLFGLAAYVEARAFINTQLKALDDALGNSMEGFGFGHPQNDRKDGR